jgi:hypothetical protein
MTSFTEIPHFMWIQQITCPLWEILVYDEQKLKENSSSPTESNMMSFIGYVNNAGIKLLIYWYYVFMQIVR